MAFWSRYPRYEKSAPRPAEGIKARHAGRGFASQWWARRWLEALKSFGWESRLQRGRSYATRGQVLDYQVKAGLVTARVQGSRARPYKVELALSPMSEQDWQHAVEQMTARASFLAMLLAGEMPADIEQAFAPRSLVPSGAGELKTSCSCPDWANPCKHVAAVHYILAEALDQDPFLLFELRGMNKDELLARIHSDAAETEQQPEQPPDPRPAEPERFWRPFRLELPLELSPPPVRLAALRRLGPPARWLEGEEFVATLGPIYQELSERARELLCSAAASVTEVEPSVPARQGRTARLDRKGSRNARPAHAGPEPGPAQPKRSDVEPDSTRRRSASPGQRRDDRQSQAGPEPSPGKPKRQDAAPVSTRRRSTGPERGPASNPKRRGTTAQATPERPRGRQFLALKVAATTRLDTAWVRRSWGLDAAEARQELESLVAAGWLEPRGRTSGKHYVLTTRARSILGPTTLPVTPTG